MQTFDTLIIGGGIVGLTLAGLLAAEDFSVALIDHQPYAPSGLKSPYDLRVSTINQASCSLFKTLTVWERMCAQRVSPYQHMRVWDAKSPAQITFSHHEVSQPHLGHVVEHSVMQQVLHEALAAQPQVRIYAATAPKKLCVNEKYACVELEGGQILAAPLLVGSDGKNSWVAQHAFPTVSRHSLSTQSALVATIRTEKPHQKTAYQRFLQTGPVAVLPLADPHLVSLVWSTTPQHAAQLKALPTPDFNQALMQALEYVLGQVEVCDVRVVFPLHSYQVPHYVAPRIALAGDAAHTILPLAGQGLNMGLMDAACLAQTIIAAHKKQRDSGQLSVLRRYERWRKSDNTTILRAMEGFNQLFTSPTEVARHIRAAGFMLTDKLPGIKKYFMEYAMGLRVR